MPYFSVIIPEMKFRGIHLPIKKALVSVRKNPKTETSALKISD